MCGMLRQSERSRLRGEGREKVKRFGEGRGPPSRADGGEKEETRGISQWEGLRNLRKGAGVGSDREILCVRVRGVWPQVGERIKATAQRKGNVKI